MFHRLSILHDVRRFRGTEFARNIGLLLVSQESSKGDGGNQNYGRLGSAAGI